MQSSDGFRLVSHVADVQVYAWAESREGLLQQLVLSLGEIAGFSGGSGEESVREFHITGGEDIVMIVDLLSDILVWMYVEFVVPRKVELLSWKATNGLRVKCKGKLIESFEKEIKAVTFHDAEFHKNPSGNWECRLIFDI